MRRPAVGWLTRSALAAAVSVRSRARARKNRRSSHRSMHRPRFTCVWVPCATVVCGRGGPAHPGGHERLSSSSGRQPLPGSLPRRVSHARSGGLCGDLFRPRRYRRHDRPGRPARRSGGLAGEGLLPERLRARAPHLLPGERSGRSARHPAAPRLPRVVAHLPRADPASLGPVPRPRARLSRLGIQRPTESRPGHLSLRPPGGACHRLRRGAGDRSVRPLHAGLRVSRGLPGRARSPRAAAGPGGAERQRVPRRIDRGAAGAVQAVPRGSLSGGPDGARGLR